jgi:hypothetical protein
MSEQPDTPEPATDAATLSDDERRKVRELLRACTPEGVELAVSILDTLDATSADWEATFDHEVSAALVECWSVVIWDGLYGRLPTRRKDLFAALAVTRFVTASQGAWHVREQLEDVWRWACARSWFAQSNQSLREFIRMQSSGKRGVFDQDFPGVTLSFVSDLDNDLVNVIADFRGDVHLDGISRLTVGQARVLARHQGWLYCNGIREVPDDVADELVKHSSHVFLEGLTELSHVGLAKKLASKPSLYLDHVVSVSDDVVLSLVQSGTRVFARQISDRLAAINA